MKEIKFNQKNRELVSLIQNTIRGACNNILIIDENWDFEILNNTEYRIFF